MAHHARRNTVNTGLCVQVDAANKLCENVTLVRNLVNAGQTGTFIGDASVVNNVYSLDGTGDAVEIDSAIGIIENDVQGSLEAWVKPSAIASDAVASVAHTTSQSALTLDLRSASSNFRVFIENAGSTLINREAQGLTVVGGTWYHLIITQTGSGMKMFVNGEEETLTSLGTENNLNAWLNDITTLDNIRIGELDYNSVGGQNCLTGEVGYLKIYNVTLALAHAKHNYSVTKHRFQ